MRTCLAQLLSLPTHSLEPRGGRRTNPTDARRGMRGGLAPVSIPLRTKAQLGAGRELQQPTVSFFFPPRASMLRATPANYFARVALFR